MVLKLILRKPLYTSMNCGLQRPVFLQTRVTSVSSYYVAVPPAGGEGSLFSVALPKLVTYCLFVVSHADSCEVIFHHDFDFHFPGD